MTKSKIQPFCKANKNNIGYFKGKEVYPGSVTEKAEALYSYANDLSLIWKSDSVSFSKVFEELKSKFTILNNGT